MNVNSGNHGDAASAEFPWPERTYHGKRLLDLVFALTALTLASPLMLVMALAIKLTSAGPVFYRGERCGLGGRRFRQLKFRTMRVDTSKGGAFTARSDPRVTAVGKFLRFSKLDELPNLNNVLRGEMSIIGPRPEDVAVVEKYYTREQLRVLSVRPGLSCLVQIHNFPDLTHHIPEGVDAEQYYQTVILPNRLESDLEYIDRMSLWLDAKIVLQTIYLICVKSWIIPWQRRIVSKSNQGGPDRS